MRLKAAMKNTSRNPAAANQMRSQCQVVVVGAVDAAGSSERQTVVLLAATTQSQHALDIWIV